MYISPILAHWLVLRHVFIKNSGIFYHSHIDVLPCLFKVWQTRVAVEFYLNRLLWNSMMEYLIFFYIPLYFWYLIHSVLWKIFRHIYLVFILILDIQHRQPVGNSKNLRFRWEKKHFKNFHERLTWAKKNLRLTILYRYKYFKKKSK